LDDNFFIFFSGPKQQRKFRRLMMHRIKWNEDSKKMAKDDGWYINIVSTDLQDLLAISHVLNVALSYFIWF
jgi:hypothetical protein